MRIALIGGSSNPELWSSLSGLIGEPLTEVTLGVFPDGELEVALLDSVRARDLYVLQSTCAPVDSNLQQLLLLTDAARRAGAGRITAVIPYFGYARQDRRSRERQPIAARLATEQVAVAGADRIVAVDLHSPAIEGFSPVPLEHVSAIALMCRTLKDIVTPDHIVVAPDAGAAKSAARIAAALELPEALVRKTRLSGSMVKATSVVGDVSGKLPVIVDDMISTGGTIAAALEAVVAAGARTPAIVAATHGLFVGPARGVLGGLDLERIVVTDTVSVAEDFHPALHKVSVAKLLAEVIRRLSEEESLFDLLKHE